MKTTLTKKGLDYKLSSQEDSRLEIEADKIVLSGKDLLSLFAELKKEIDILKEETKKMCSCGEMEKEISSLRKDIEKLGKQTKEKVVKE
jgi:uncharacterized small protein (DUF1192 family)